MKIPFLKSLYNRFLYLRYYFKKGIRMNGRVKFKGNPLINIKKGGKIIFGKNITINSRNKNYHANMFKKVKLLVDENNASMQIGKDTRIHGTCIHAKKSIVIGKRCLIAANSQIIDSNGHDTSFENVSNRINTLGYAEEIIIEDDVWISLGCIILPGVKIGKGSIIGAGSVVNKDIPENSIAIGNPAKVVKTIK